jgi:hypothetical protein
LLNSEQTKAELMSNELYDHYSAPSTKNNQIAAMLTVQNTLLNESLQMLKDLVSGNNQAIARERALVLIKAITDNNYPMGAVLDIRPTLTAIKDLKYD